MKLLIFLDCAVWSLIILRAAWLENPPGRLGAWSAGLKFHLVRANSLHGSPLHTKPNSKAAIENRTHH